VSSLEEVATHLIRQAVIYLPHDVKEALQKAYCEESSATAKTQLKAILDNIALAEKRQTPICQDTGTLTFYVRAGSEVSGLDQVEEALICATRKATIEVPLRPNSVNPLTGKNTGDNIGRMVPQLHWEIVSGHSLEITVLAKGGGSENVCALAMVSPGEGLQGVKRVVIDAVVKAGAQPCPPTILGVAFGGNADTAMALAKRSLLRPLGESHPTLEIAQLEQELFEAANMTGIGPMGLGGKTTVLDVHVDYAFRHPASFPVAVAFSCWCARRATARVYANGKVEYLTQKAGNL